MAYESTLEQWAVGGRHSFKTKYKAPAGSFGENGGFFIGFLQKKTIKKKPLFSPTKPETKNYGEKR